MTSRKAAISVVVPAYNEQTTLGALLESLSQQTTSKSFEVIVVNNASTDATKEIAEQYQNKLNLTIINEPHKGRGVARATGFNHTRGEIIFSTDADATVPPDWISRLSTYFEDNTIVAVSGMCRVHDLTKLGNFVVNAVQPLGMRIFALLYGTPWLSGINFAIRRAAYFASGGFNPTLQALEDAELALRVRNHGHIKMITDTPVTASGRRFTHHGLARGLLSYISQFLSLRYLGNQNVTLDDPR